jgi:hypothetical protein
VGEHELGGALIGVEGDPQGERAERRGEVLGVARGGQRLGQVQAPRARLGLDDLTVSDREDPVGTLDPPALITVKNGDLWALWVRQGQEAGVRLDGARRRGEGDRVRLRRAGVAEHVLAGAAEAEAGALVQAEAVAGLEAAAVDVGAVAAVQILQLPGAATPAQQRVLARGLGRVEADRAGP